MDKGNLDPEEQDLLASYERQEWKPVADFESEAACYRNIARETFREDARVNIRISSKDLESLKKRALEEGIPYQTLIASVLHKYISGRLVDRLR
jgi:predicted DNA binding CopG/RHH family protein